MKKPKRLAEAARVLARGQQKSINIVINKICDCCVRFAKRLAFLRGISQNSKTTNLTNWHN